MKTLKPSFYDEFACAADNCDYTCCMDWGIHLTREEVSRYGAVKDGEFMEHIAVEEDGRGRICFDENGLCPLLNERGLCSLVLERGVDFLSNICNDYPRFVTRMDGTDEYHLSNGCGEVLKYYLDMPSPMQFVKGEAEPFPRGDERVFPAKLMKAREDSMAILELGILPLWVRLFIIHRYAGELSVGEEPAEVIRARYLDPQNLMNMKSSLEATGDNVSIKRQMLYQLIEQYNASSREKRAYRLFIKELEDSMDILAKESPETDMKWGEFAAFFKKYETFFEHFCVNYYYSHVDVIGADGFFAPMTTLLMLEIAMIRGTAFVRWTKKGGELSDTELIHLCSYYARMIEHSMVVNIEFIISNKEHPWFSDAGFLLLLR